MRRHFSKFWDAIDDWPANRDPYTIMSWTRLEIESSTLGRGLNPLLQRHEGEVRRVSVFVQAGGNRYERTCHEHDRACGQYEAVGYRHQSFLTITSTIPILQGQIKEISAQQAAAKGNPEQLARLQREEAQKRSALVRQLAGGLALSAREMEERWEQYHREVSQNFDVTALLEPRRIFVRWPPLLTQRAS